MNRRTFMMAVAMSPAPIASALSSDAALTSHSVPVHQAYPVTYGDVLCFYDPRICGCGWSDHNATGPLALKGSFYEMIRPASRQSQEG
jgi:hypothetical protein